MIQRYLHYCFNTIKIIILPSNLKRGKSLLCHYLHVMCVFINKQFINQSNPIMNCHQIMAKFFIQIVGNGINKKLKSKLFFLNVTN